MPCCFKYGTRSSLHYVPHWVRIHLYACAKGELSELTLYSQHKLLPDDQHIIAGITHIFLAFVRSDIFHLDNLPADYDLPMSIDEIRERTCPGTKVSVAIGGWGDSKGFEAAAKDEVLRRKWSQKVKEMVEFTGIDGVDIDWEYPG